MAENERTISTVFRADISQFSASTQQLNRYIKEVNSEFSLATAGMGKWSDNADGLQAKITQLNRVLEAEEKKLESLESAYAELVAQGKENTKEAQKLRTEINNQGAVVKKTKKDIEYYSDSLKELEDAGVQTKEELADLNKEMDNTAKSGASFGGVAKGIGAGVAAIGAAAVGAVAGFLSLAESTKELRKMLGGLEASFATSGHSAEAAQSTFEGLYGVLGDEGKANEAALHLSQLAKTEDELAAYTNTLTGVYATFGDSLPVEGLAEAMNHTANLGSVQGVLADALEWSGVNVDDFNKQLEGLNTEEERAQLIQETLNGLYGEAAENYKEVNKNVIEAQEAQMGLNNALAKLGEIAEPIMTSIKVMTTDLLEAITPFVELIGQGLKGALEGTAGAASLFAEGLTGIVDVLVDRVTTMLPGIIDIIIELVPQIIEALLNALPTVVSTLASMISQVITALGEMLPQVINAVIEAVPLIVQAITDALPQFIQAVLSLVMSIVQALPEIITNLLNAIDDILNTIIDAVIEAFPMLIDAAIQLLMAIVDAIPVIIQALTKNLPRIINTIIDGVIKALPLLLDGAIQLFMAIVDAIPQIIPELISALPTIISTIVSTLLERIPDLIDAGLQLLGGLVEGLLNPATIGRAIKSLGKAIENGVKSFFGIHSPSTLFRDEIGKNLALGIGEGFEDNIGGIMNDMQHTVDKITPSVEMVGSAGVNIGSTNNDLISQIAQLVKGGGNITTTNNFNYTFEKMETTQLALHKAQLETKRIIGGNR